METGGDGALLGSTAPIPSLTEVMKAVSSLADLMSSHGLTRLDVNVGAVAIRLRSTGGDEAPNQLEAFGESETTLEPPIEIGIGHVIAAPMIGTYYASSAPGDAPFVHIGDYVEVGQVIGIIEAMKIMNEIAAEHAGVVQEIFVQNAQAVEYGSPLMRVLE